MALCYLILLQIDRMYFYRIFRVAKFQQLGLVRFCFILLKGNKKYLHFPNMQATLKINYQNVVLVRTSEANSELKKSELVFFALQKCKKLRVCFFYEEKFKIHRTQFARLNICIILTIIQKNNLLYRIIGEIVSNTFWISLGFGIMIPMTFPPWTAPDLFVCLLSRSRLYVVVCGMIVRTRRARRVDQVQSPQ